MRSVSLNSGGSGDKAFAELNYHMRYEHREVRDGVVGEGQDLSEEDESRINAVRQDVTDGREQAVQAQPSSQKQQQQPQPQGSVVRWDKFLPLRSLKVLLVETDDSTRHVVSALLRNCSYEVTAVANGIQAWQILRDLTNHIDLILTEVIMPGLSGIALLCKIMNHKTCKNIPVIMMSSHDSMGIVFKCLSKGAVDFLVKPIRKNELKNLWQHVWRRCHSSSGSGSESGIQMQKSNSVEEFDNDSGSNDVDDNVRDGSDNGSGTQSSWTKRAVEVDSPQPTHWDQVVNHTDSTCAQVIHAKPETFGKKRMPVDSRIECSERDKKLLDNVAMGKDLEIGVPRNPQQEYETQKAPNNLLGTKHDKVHELVPEKNNEQLQNGPPEVNYEKSIGELRAQFGSNVIPTTNSINPLVEVVASETPNALSKISEIENKTTSNPKELPSLELSLNRPKGVGDVGTLVTHDERNILRHSDMSAFSRYNTASTANQAPTGIVGSCSPLDNSSEAMKTESMYNQQSNESTNNNDMGSTTKNIFTKPTGLNEKSTSTSTERYIHTSAFRPVANGRIVPTLQNLSQKVDDLATNALVTPTRDAHQQVQVQHHHHHYHHHHHHVHNMQQQQKSAPDEDDLSLSIPPTSLQCGTTNVFGGSMEGNGGSYGLNESASGSNNGTSRQNVSNKDVNACGTNMDNDIGVTGKIGVGGASGSGSGVDQNENSQRVAALTKFRQKRKERCFEKKVRYQSRKRLAEQRPRVRGQFVRQKVGENNGDADS